MLNYQESKLNKHEQKMLERRRQQRAARIKRWWVLLFYGLGISCLFKGIGLYHDTFITYKLPIGGGFIFGLAVSFIISKDYRDCFLPIIPLMGLFIMGLLSINSIFADKKNVTLKEIIIEKHHSYKHGPYAVIKFRDFKRNIGASSDSELDSMSYGVLTVNKGLLGYYVIRDFKLTKD